MYKKRILIILILISILFTISAASAVDADDSNITASGFDDDILNVSSDSPVLGEGEGSFSDLQSLIDANSEITLDKNYKFDASMDSALKDGIKLNKTVTISGNNIFSIDGDNQARIFDITGNNVILKDIILINAKSDGNGGALAITAGSGSEFNNLTISNSKSAGDGGAIYLSGTATATRLKDIKIDHSSSDRNGGGIYTDTMLQSWNDLVDFNSITITYSSAVCGGAFYLNSLASANNFEFNHNTATDKGGAIYFSASYPENMEGYLYNSTFINNTAKDAGALYLLGANGAFKNITLINNRATGSSSSSGGAMSVIGTNWKIVDGYAFNNTAAGDGGAVYWTGHKGLIDNVTFIKNSASYIGGGVYFDGTVNTTVKNSKFDNNSAGTNGGALDWSSGSNYCTLINSNFTNNTAARSGGAVYVRGDYVSIYDSKFESNEAYGTTNADNRNPNKYTTLGGNGGAIIYIGSHGYVENSEFLSNIADKSGGAIYLQRNTNTTFKKSRFINNTAGADGGAIDLYEHAQYAQILDSEFTNNTVGRDGGAVNFATGSSNAIIHNSTFDFNTAKRNGGALCWEGTEGNVSYCNFSYNRVTGETLLYDVELTMEDIIIVYALPEASESTKGKLYILDKSVSDDNITFVSYVTVEEGDSYKWLQLEEINIVNDTAPSAQDWGLDRFFGGDGGAILWSGNIATIDHCIFIGSESARRGGGAYMTGGDNVTFSNCHFENGTSGTNGGGVDWLAGANYGKLINCTFIHNNATRSAGAIYYDGDYGEFINVTIIDNHAHGNMDEMHSINGVNFAGWDTSHWDTNTTGGDGGAMMLTGDNILLYNITFANNSAVGRGGAVFIQDNDNVTFELCTFENNEALGTAQNTFNDDKNLDSGLNMLLTGHGGAIGFDVGADNGEIISCTFTNNNAALDGGAINFATGSTHAYIFNSTFDYNTAKRNGGALCWEGTEGNVSYCNFSYNRATGEFLPADFTLTMENIIIVDAMPEASAETMNKLYIVNNSANKNNITFISYVAVKDGDSYSWLLLEEINIVNDTAPSAQDWGLDRFFGGDGGTILWSGNIATIDHCIFVGSESARRGGGAYMTGGDNVTFSNCHFENGTSGTNGGGVDWLAGANYGKLINCTFIHNNAARSAGAIYYDGDYGEFTNITIIDNKANGGSLKRGTVDYAGWDTSHWDTNTTGGDAGSLMITGDHIRLYNVTFINNTAVGRGGAVFLQDNDDVVFELCTFENNIALGTANNTYNDDKNLSSGRNILHTGNGGAIAFDSGASNGYVMNSYFFNNTAARNGGAISFYTGSSNATIFNSTFDHNTAYRSGGAFFWDGINGNISYCNFSYNKALGTALEYDMVLTYENIEIVSALPASGVPNRLYIVDQSNATTTIYKSYVVDKDGSWLLLDQTEIVGPAPSAKDWGMDQFFGGNGGTILWGGDVGIIDNCNFWYSESARRGGGAYMRGSDNVTISNSYFENCTSGTNGGGVDWLAGANYGKVINSTFKDTRAARSAGAIYYDGDYGEMTNITIINAQSYGGSLTESYEGNVNYAGWDSSHWDTNTTGGDAGAIMITGDHVYIYNATFSDCVSVGRGGAVFLQDNENVTIDSSTFTNNRALGIANNTWENYEAEHDESSDDTKIDQKLSGHGGAVAFDVGAKNCLINNSEFTDNNARRDGGAVNFAVGALYNAIMNSKFTDNSVYDDGGAINWEGNEGLIYNITCYDNIGLGQDGSTSKGGTICITGSNVTITKSSFTLGRVFADANAKLNETDGGAIFVTGNNVNITDSTFDSCTSPNNAGGINVIGNDILIGNCTFDECDAAEKGGAIFISGLNAKIVNSKFKNSNVNHITGLGGSIYIVGNDATILGSEFDSSSAFQGGVIYVEGDNCNVSYSSFNNSYAAKDGGAMYSTGSYSGVYYSNFTANEAEYDGGGIYWFGGKNSKNNSVIGCIFTDNIAYAKGVKTESRTTFGGGGLYWSEGGSYGTLKDSQFYNNSVRSNQKADGGAVLWDKSSHGIIDNCYFDGNYITTSNPNVDWVQGGALFLRARSNFTISNCDFINSSSYCEGGAMYLSNTNPISPIDVLVVNTTFRDNVAESKGPHAYGGGAIQIKECFNVKLLNVTFINNTANQGGAVSIFETKGNTNYIENCTFIGNNASNRGGSIYAKNHFYIYNSPITDGYAGEYGGGIFTTSTMTYDKLVFINNTAKNGGGLYWNMDNAVIENMEFINNTALNSGGGIYINNKGVTVSNVNLTGNKAVTGSAIYATYDITLNNVYLIENQANSDSLRFKTFNTNTGKIEILFKGNDNYLNAIFMKGSTMPTCTNVTYWGADGQANTGLDSVILSGAVNPTPEAGQNITVKVFDDTGKLLAKNYYLTNEDGTVSLDLHDVVPEISQALYKEIYVEAELTNDKYYTLIKLTSRIASEVTASANKTRYHSNSTVNVSVSDGATGNVSVYLNETFLGNITLSDSKGSMDISTLIDGKYLQVGNYTLTFFYNGNAKYDVSNTTATLEITKTDSIILINATPKGYNMFINVTVLNADGDVVSNISDVTGYVTLSVNHRDFVVELVNGTGSGELYNLPKGQNLIEATYSGDRNYYGSYNYTTAEITENVRTFIDVEVNAEDIMVDESIQINVTIISADNSVVNGNVTIFLDNTGYVIALNNSRASFNKTGLSAGYKLVAVIFEGNEDLAPSSGFGSFNVNKYDAFVKIDAKDIGYGTDEVINITVPDDAKGSVNVIIKGNEFNYEYGLEINNGTVLVPMSYFGIDEYNITVSFEDDRYKLTTNTSSFKVFDKSPSEITINVSDITIGDDLIVYVNVTENATGQVRLIIAGNTYTATLNNSKANFTVSNLIARNYHITAQYLGDINYFESTDEADFVVNKKSTPIEVSVTNSTVGSVECINVTLDENATGYVLINIGGVHYYNMIDNGTAQFNVTGLLIGNYTIEVTYMGSDYYSVNSTTAELSISKIPVYINITSHDIIVDQDETLVIKTSENITALIKIEINNRNYTTFINEGEGSLVISGLKSGNYNVTVYYDGDDEFLPVSNVTSFTVSDKSASKVSINVSDITIGQTLTVKVNVTDGATGNVTIILAGDIYTVDLTDGAGSVDISGLIARDYHVTAIYNGDGNFTSSQTEGNFKVNKKNTPITVNVTNSTVGSVEYINVTVDEAATGYVLINIDGVHYYESIDNGIAKFEITGLLIGNYTIEVTYMGDDNYAVNSTTADLSISKIPVYINVTGHDIIVDQDETLKIRTSENITSLVTVEINGENHTTFISNGEGSLILSGLASGSYDVTVYYAGDDEFLPVSNVTSFTVMDKYASQVTVNVTDITIGETLTVKVNVTDGATGTVTIILAGDIYTVDLTDGVGSVDISGLIARDYHVTAIYNGDGNFTSSQTEASFKVNKKDTSISVKAENITVGQIETVTVDITDGTTGVVLININGIDYFINITFGQYKLELDSLSVGNYTVDVAYVGDSNYGPATNSTKFKVEKITPELTIEVTQGKIAAFGENVAIKLTGPGDVTGVANVYLTLDGVINPVPYTVYINNGVGYLTIEKPSVGNYNVSAVYLENYKYVSINSNNDTFEVYMNGSSIDVNAQNINVGDNETIKVTFPKGEFAGNVTIFVGETEYSAPIVFDGTISTATLNVTGLASGLYIVTASFAYTNETAGTTIVYEGTTTFTVDKIASAMTIDSIEDIKVGDNVTIKLNISPSDATGNIDVYVNGEKYTISNDNYTLVIPNLASAHYNVQAFYQGNNKYLASNASAAFNVVKNNIDISLNVSDIDVGNVEYINVTLESDAEGYVLISVNDTKFYAEIIDGVAKVIIYDIGVGRYVVTATFLGDDKYYSNSTTESFTVSKLKTGIQIDGSDIIVGQEEFLHFSTGDNLTVVVIIEVNGTNYTSFVREGKGNYTLYELKEGKYTVKVYFNGDDKYDAVYNQTTFNVTGKLPSDVSINVTDITIGEDLVVYVNVTDGATGEVHLVIAGNTYTATLNDSKANFTISNLTARNYHITVEYLGDDKYLTSRNTAEFVVNKKITEISANVTNSTVGSVEYINVTVEENATGSVLIRIGETNYYAEISNGVARFNITGLLTGDYEANVTYSGDDNYKSSAINVNLTVSKIEASITISAENVTVGEDVELTIVTPQNITSVVYVEIDGVNYTTFLQDGKGNLTVRGLSVKDYTATVYYNGDYIYMNVTNSTQFTVYDKKQSQVNASVESIYVGDDAIVYVNVTNGATGQVVVVIAGTIYNATLVDGKANFTVSNLIARNYHVTVQYNGDDYFYGSTNSTDFVVNKKITPISANVTNSTVGDVEYINVTVDENATGYVLINISGSHYYADIDNGIARFNITGLLVGNYTAYISYVGDDKFNSTALEVDLTVSKIKTLINITGSDITIGQNEKLTIRTSENITDLICIEIDGVNYTTFIDDGVGTFDIVNLTSKEYTITVYYNGDDRYFAAQNKTTITVSAKKSSEITVNVSDITVGDDAIVYVNVTDGAEGTVTIVIAGDTYSKDLVNGKANFTVSDLIARNYHVTAIYAGNEYYLNATNSTTFKVNKKDTSIDVDVTNSTVGDVEYVNVTVDKNATGYILINIEGVHYYGEIDNGVAKFNITGLSVGNHEMNVTYIGDGNYNSNETLGHVDIAQKTTLINITAENITVGGVVTLVIETSQNITDLVTVEINGLNHTTFIDDGYGVLEVHNLGNGTYTAVVYYAGSYEYEKAQNQTTFTVYDKKQSQVNVTVESIYVGDDAIVYVNVTNGATGQVVAVIAGTIYNATLVDGKANFTVSDLIARNYHVTVQYNGDDNYYGSTNSTDFVVNKKNTAIEAVVTNSTVGSIEFVEVTVNANATGTILLSVNGSNYYERIDNGVARFNITGLLVGNYTAYITYIGDDKYNENSTEAKISISKKSTLINITGVDITIGAEEELTITTSENITSLVTVKIGNDNYTTFISEGVGKLVIYGLSNGTYTATVYYKGDDEFIAVSNSTTFVVSDKKSSLIDVNVEDITVGENAIIEVNVTDGATGYVSLVIAGNTYRELLNDGKATFNVSNLIARDYHITVEYLGDDNYYGSENSASFTVNKKNSAIEVNVSDITVGESVELKINITNGTTGVVLIDINGTDYYATIEDGQAVLVVNNLIVGDYEVIVEYEGDANYNASTAKANFTVTKLPSEITITVSEGKLAAEGSNVVIDLVGMDDVTGISTVTVTSGDVVTNYTVYINNGVGSLIIQPAVGHYSVVATYLENHKYLSNTSNTDTFEVYDNGGEIGVITDNIDVGQTENITVILSGNFTGKATIHVANGTHEVILTYNETTNSSSAVLPVEGLVAGEYAVSVEYNHTEGDRTVLYVGESKFTVNKIPSQISINPIESIKVGENVTITFNISPNEATGNVTVYVNGVRYELNTGNLTLVIPGLAANQYHVQAFYEGDHKYVGSQAESSFEVVKNNVTIELNVTSINVGDNEIINVTVNSDATGYVLINVSGTHYYAEINNGVATVTVKDLTAGTYHVNATFIEDDKYFTKSIVDEFTVSRLKTSIEINATDIVLGQDELLKFNLSDNLTVVVILEIDGNNYTSFVSEGKGNFTIAAPAVGPHTVKVYFTGNDMYDSASNETSFVVADKKVSDISIEVQNITIGENETVKVTITKNATGNVTIVIRGNEYTKQVDENGVATFSISGLTARDYEVTAIYGGDTYYAGSSNRANFTVNKIASAIDLNVSDIVMGDVEIINVSVTDGATGVVLINISGTCYYGQLEDGKATFNVAGLKSGEYEAKVTYMGNDRYNESSNSKTFIVKPQITVEVGDNNGNSTQLTIKVSDNSTGEVTVVINGTPYTAKVENGTAIVNVSAVTPGEQNITVIYAGEGESTTEQNKTVVIPNIGGYDMSMNVSSVKAGENATITVKVPSDATGNVTLVVNNQTLSSEIKNGVATFSDVPLEVGNNNIEAKYDGDDKYASNSVKDIINVENDVPTVNAEDLVRGWNSLYDYEAVFTNELGEALDGVTVTYVINGKSYDVKTEKGIAKLTTSNLAIGEYDVASINPVTGEQVTKHLSIVPRLIENKDITMDFADGTYYVVRVIDDDGTPVGKGEIVSISANGVHYVAETDANGYARLKINLNPKTYTVTSKYKDYSVSNKLVVKQTLKLVKKTVTVKKTAKKLVLQAKLKWSNGKAIKGKKIVFKFKGKKYTAKTNSKGIAKVTIKKKVIKKLKKGKKYKFTATYLSNTVKGKVKVKK